MFAPTRCFPKCILCLIPAAFSCRPFTQSPSGSNTRISYEITGFCHPQHVFQARGRSQCFSLTHRSYRFSSIALRRPLSHSIGRISMSEVTAHRDPRPPKKIAVIGGGLAGLAVVYNLLDLTRSPDSDDISITIIDSHEVGHGGASGVMAGLLHPLTPRGKKLWMVMLTSPSAYTTSHQSLFPASLHLAAPRTHKHGI
jgi:hypothetical protein